MLPTPARLPASAVASMLALTLFWGVQQVLIKLTLPDVAPAMQAFLRYVLAAVALTLFMLATRRPILARDGTLVAGIGCGLLFGVEFLLIFLGLTHTTASRGSLLIFTMPFFMMILSALFLREERVTARTVIGGIVAFAGLVLAFADGLVQGGGTLLGDVMILGAAFGWALTTLVIKTTALKTAPAANVLWYQLVFSLPVYFAGVVVLGEPWPTSLAPISVFSLLYQGVFVAFATYLVWFGMVARYPAAQLSVFTLFTPIFGVAAGVVVLGDTLTVKFFAAVVLVIAGVTLVNWPGKR